MREIENAAALIGRILICLLFVVAGWGKLMAAAATQEMFAKQGLPMVEGVWLLAVAIELGGGLLILVGVLTRPLAFILACWCVATALVAHTNLADSAQKIQFFKNMGLTGGFLYIAVFGAGGWSLDAWLRARRGAVAAE
jgi:putative oxidoreductase